MAMLTVIAPGTPVTVRGMSLPGAEVVSVRVRSGVNPIVYEIAWETSSGMRKTAKFLAIAVDSTERRDETPRPRGLRDLGALFKQERETQGEVHEPGQAAAGV